MSRLRASAAFLVAALVLAMVAPSGAAETRNPRAARDAALARKAQLATQLNALKASEKQLLAAAAAINNQVVAEAARVDAARRAVRAAETELAEATQSLNETRGARDRLTKLFVERAVDRFISPRPGEGAADVGTTRDLAAEARREALLEAVAASDDDLKDQLDSAEEDYQLQQAAAAAAREKAQARKAETEARLAALERTQASQRQLRNALTTRQREVLSEITAQDRAASALQRILERASAPPAGGAGTSARSGGCIWPARGRVTSEYGSRWGRLHAGIDIGAPTGTPIWAAKSGTVIFAGRQSGYGNVVIIDHGGGMTTLYGHMSRIGTRDGASVGQGSTIGAVGSTGHSTGPHLHFETRYGGSPRNPRGCLG
jgi:murein DD-endopeptidase MepM/ murein hydrolase activator NlpD